MPVTPTYPGVYVEEVPSGVRTITGVATSITAFVGYTERGSVNKAVRIFNLGDYERTFGGLHHDSLVSYAVHQFFLNGGTDAYIVRVAEGADTANVVLKSVGNIKVLTISAANEGVWGNFVRLVVDYDTSNPDSTFNLTVSRYQKQSGKLTLAETEKYRNLSMNSRSTTYAPSVVNSASKLVELTRTKGLTFSNPGYSLGGKLSSVPALSSGDTITGTINGSKSFTLTLTSIPSSLDLDGVVSTIKSAIKNAGLESYLEVTRASVDGKADTTSGEHIKLVGKSTASEREYSSVQISKSAQNDAAVKLKLGLRNGGREVSGASEHRPAPTGTLSGDLSKLIGTDLASADWKVTIEDHASSPATELISGTIKPAKVKIGTALRDELQNQIRTKLKHAAAQNATVELVGTFLRVIPSADTPNVTVTLTSTDAAVKALGFPTATTKATFNVQQYSLGTGAVVGAQSSVNAGKDGSKPTAKEYQGSYKDKTGIYALRDVDLFNLLIIPGTTQLDASGAKKVLETAMAFCEQRRAFLLVDPDPNQSFDKIDDWVSSIGTTKNAAVFYPSIEVSDPLNGYRASKKPPSGTVAGVMARTDSERGVWKAPAGTDAVLRGVQKLTYTLTDPENGVLNQLGINCLRSFPVYGKVVWGARTLEGADRLASEWKYIPVRRLALYIEESLYRGTQWVVFEPNDEPLWAQIRLNVGAFMHDLFRQGAFQGVTPKEAYLVKCDKETTTQSDINKGIVNILVGFAPLKPAEFVIIKIQQLAGQIAA